MQGGLPKPGPALKIILIGLLAIWLVFALGLNWGNVSEEAFFLFTGNNDAILKGQLWRIFTAPLLHVPSQTISHILSAMIGLYFLGSTLESTWGSKRFVRFLISATLLSYLTQFLLVLALGPEIGAKLAPAYYFGAMPAVEATAIAWACSFRGRTVNLFFVLPVSSTGLILFVVGMSLMMLIAGSMNPSGYIALFAGMGWGYLLGGGTPSPLRRFYLRYRLSRLEAEARTDSADRKKRAKSSGLRVIEGGRDPGGPRDPDRDKKILH